MSHRHEGICGDIQLQFLGEFAKKCRLGRFARLDLASCLHEGRGAALAHDKRHAVGAKDKGGNNADRLFHGGDQNRIRPGATIKNALHRSVGMLDPTT